MTSDEKLALLKQDLQMLTSANDDFLKSLIAAAEMAIQREGIVLVENDMDIDMAVVQYAAYLFRKRASNETSMPRFLRWSLNNILFSQKGQGNGGNI
nr:MAG TPA: Head Tail Connector Protein [Caudoviricetes sp.]